MQEGFGYCLSSQKTHLRRSYAKSTVSVLCGAWKILLVLIAAVENTPLLHYSGSSVEKISLLPRSSGEDNESTGDLKRDHSPDLPTKL